MPIRRAPGTVTGGGVYDTGTTVTVKATAAAGWKFVNWTGPVANPTAASTTVKVTADTAVTANFMPVYALTVTASPSGGGKVTGAGSYVAGTVVTVTATANSGYQFVNWSGPVADPNATSTTVTVGRSHHGDGQLHSPLLHDRERDAGGQWRR